VRDLEEVSVIPAGIGAWRPGWRDLLGRHRCLDKGSGAPH